MAFQILSQMNVLQNLSVNYFRGNLQSEQRFTKTSLNVLMAVPASYIFDHWEHHGVSIFQGIRVRRYEPVSRYNAISYGSGIVKLVPVPEVVLIIITYRQVKKELLWFCDQWKEGPSRGQGKNNTKNRKMVQINMSIYSRKASARTLYQVSKYSDPCISLT